jgi:hypothetical protein
MEQVRYAAILLAKTIRPAPSDPGPVHLLSLQLKKGRIRETKNARLLFVSIVLLTGSVLAQSSEFQPGKVLSVEKVASDSKEGGTDSPTPENRQAYTVNIQLNDTVYVCRVDSVQEKELEHYEGKELPVRVNGKTLDVKEPGNKVVKLGVVNTKNAE